MVEEEKRVSKNTGKKAVSRAPLAAEAKKALAEAEARRRKKASAASKAKEIGGPAGPEPTRYGDWEKKGIASDF
jgi:hypothetical protein